MEIPVRSEADAKKASAPRKPFPPGPHPGRITSAIEKLSSKNNPMFEFLVDVTGKDGTVREMRDFVVPSADFHALKFRHVVEAVGALSKWEATNQLEAADFPGHDLIVILEVERSRGFQPKNVIVDYRPAASVVALREVR